MKLPQPKLETSNLIDHIHKPRNNRDKRSLLTFGGLLNFLFGTADDEDVESMKQDIQRLYDNQDDQSKVLNYVISITNISRGLTNENILKINQIISTISFLNETIDSVMNQLKPLFTAQRFVFLHTESLIHHSRIISLLRQMKNDIDLIKAHLNIYSIGRLTPTITDPMHLRQELLRVHKQLPARLSLHAVPHSNTWHYYKFLTITPATHGNNLILMIKIPLVNLELRHELVQNIHSSHILSHYWQISKVNQLEGTNLAMTN